MAQWKRVESEPIQSESRTRVVDEAGREGLALVRWHSGRVSLWAPVFSEDTTGCHDEHGTLVREPKRVILDNDPFFIS